MHFGTFHKKKRLLINKIKINSLSFLFKKKDTKKPEASAITSCLLIHDNSKLGDLIVLSALYRALAAKNIKLYIISCGIGHAFLKANPGITQFFIKDSNNIGDVLQLQKTLAQYHFDVVLDPFETLPSFGHALLLSGLRNHYILGFDKWYKRYYSSYHPHDENLTEHMASRTKVIYEHLFGEGATYDDRYDLPLPQQVEQDVQAFVGNSQIVVVNPIGAKKICKLSDNQIQLIDGWLKKNHPGLRIIYTGHPKDMPLIPVENIETLPFKEFIYAVALTKYCQYVISVDTALVHIASAYDRPTLAFYPKARHEDYPSPIIWAPNNLRAHQVISPTCSASDIEDAVLIDALQQLFQK
jgi:ADP-heptose:LPS heptosyltransferase